MPRVRRGDLVVIKTTRSYHLLNMQRVDSGASFDLGTAAAIDRDGERVTKVNVYSFRDGAPYVMTSFKVDGLPGGTTIYLTGIANGVDVIQALGASQLDVETLDEVKKLLRPHAGK